VNVGKSLKDGFVELKKRYSRDVVKVSVRNGLSEFFEALERIKMEYDPKEMLR